MVKRNKIILVWLTVALFLFCAVMCFNVFYNKNVSAAELIVSEEILDKYSLGETFDAPSAKISYNSKQYDAKENVLLYFPSGSVFEGKSFKLTEEGNYSIEYSAVIDGKTVTAVKNFAVANLPYSVSGDSTYNYIDKLHLYGDNDESIGGLTVELSPNGKFVYNKPIDISKATENTPIFTFSPYQYSHFDQSSSKYSPSVNDEVNIIMVRLTDVNDPDLYVDWCFCYRKDVGSSTSANPGLTSQYYLVSARANGQDLVGIDPDVERWYNYWVLEKGLKTARLVTVDGLSYAGRLGALNSGLSFGGYVSRDLGTPNGGYFSIYFNPETNRVYADNCIKNGDQLVKKHFWVNDLDESGIYANNSFTGFTTGEVYLSVWAEDYIENKFRFDILDIYGKSGDELKPETNLVDDTREPDIFYVTNMPSVLYANVGDSVNIPEATAYDVHLKDFSAVVYYSKGSSIESLVSVEDNKFIPAKSGEYTIVYTATDSYGNSKSLELRINALIKTEEVESDVLRLEKDLVGDSQAGQWINLPKYNVLSKNGNVSLHVYLVFGDEISEIDLSDSEPKFFLSHVGQYSLKYVYSDVLTTETDSNNSFNSLASDKIVFDDFALPHYMIKNAEYTIDSVNAYQFKSVNPTENVAKIFVKEDEGDFVEVTGNFKVNASSKVQFKYVFGTEEIVSNELPVIDVGFGGKLSMDKYFAISGESSITKEKDGITISKATAGSETVEFINTIPFSTFRFAFSLNSLSGTVDAITMKLTDYYDSNNVINVTLTPSDTSVALDVNGEKTIIVKNLYEDDFEFYYNAATKSFSEKGGKFVNIESPFTSNRVFFEFAVQNATSGFGLKISKVGNQTVSNATRDYFPGTIVYDNIYGGSNTPNSIVTVSKAQGLDVLSPYRETDTVLSVRDMDNNYVYSTDGVMLYNVVANRDYNFVVEKGKSYIVGYGFVDQNNQSQTGNYNIIALSVDDPIITLDNGLDDKCFIKVKRGDVVSVAGYKAKAADGTTDKLNVLIYILTPKNELYLLTEKAFVAEIAGEYTVLYKCLDEYGNYAMQSYAVVAR